MRERPAIKRPHQASGGGREGIYSRHFDACGPKQQGFSPPGVYLPAHKKKRHQALAEGVRDRLAIKRPHQRSGGGCVFAAGKYGKAGSRGVGGGAPNYSREEVTRTPDLCVPNAAR